MTTITEEDVLTLRHMVGADARPSERGFRNYYAACREQAPVMARLVVQGLVVQSELPVVNGGYVYFHATRLGCVVAGLDENMIKRALGRRS